MKKRQCSTCKKSYPHSNFYKCPTSVGGLKHICKPCHIYQSIIRNRDRRANRKAKLVAIGGGKCRHCQQVMPSYLFDFHHPDPSKKELSDFNCVSEAQAIAEVKKCLLLCKHCHFTEHHRLQELVYERETAKFLARIKPIAA